VLGIDELKGDVLKNCHASSATVRPSDSSSTGGSYQALIVLGEPDNDPVG